MSSLHDLLQEGQRFWYMDRPCTLLSKDYDYDDSSYSYSITYRYVIRFDDSEGGRLTVDGQSAYRLYEGMVFNPEAGYSLGDTMEIKRTGLEPNLRGTLLEINKDAERWPYRVGEAGSNSVWFTVHELTKIHSVVSHQRAPRAIEILRAQIALTRAELEALETALEVLEYATT